MKRTIIVKSEGLVIEARLSADDLSASQAKEIRDELATRLMRAATELPYLWTPLCDVKVK